MQSLQYPPEQQARIVKELHACGLVHVITSSSSSTDPLEIESSAVLQVVTKDFLPHDAAQISNLLMNDFGLTALSAHQTRAALVHLHGQKHKENLPKSSNGDDDGGGGDEVVVATPAKGEGSVSASAPATQSTASNINGLDSTTLSEEGEENDEMESSSSKPRVLYKQFIVNDKAKQRKNERTPRYSAQQQSSNKTNKTKNNNDYGLPRGYARQYPALARQLDHEFMNFMTRPNTHSQGEEPIRPATAKVYMRHAKLFLGWYIRHHHHGGDRQQAAAENDTVTNGLVVSSLQQQQGPDENKDTLVPDEDIDLQLIFPNSTRASATPIIDFILWLRQDRHISVSYEANVLRGLIKLLKFRFCQDEHIDDDNNAAGGTDGVKPFDNVPVIRQVRQLHRSANKRQAVAPRSSAEDRKWLSWPDYLTVVQQAKAYVEQLLSEHEREETDAPKQQQQKKKNRRPSSSSTGTPSKEKGSLFTPAQRRIAVAFQKYLILSIFAHVPDRQRTIRELQLGRSFVKKDGGGANKSQQHWCVTHAPGDYKTGKTYGERPPLRLPASLTAAIDEFIDQWRPCLLEPAITAAAANGDDTRQDHNYLFVQSRTGQPLTQDSVYQIVGRTCFQYTGQRTNPHLLRDMIITHVREQPDTSERELEALALYMGHSIQVQRASYDRRTLQQKVAPAVELLESVNSKQ